MSKALDIANNLSEFDGLTPAIDLSDVTATNITPTNLNIASTNHTFTVKGIDAAITDSQSETSPNVSDADSGQLAIYNGATKLWGINESGWVQQPNVPAFSVGLANTATNFGAGGTVIFNDDSSLYHFNDGNHYSTSTGKFTAPIDGRYMFYAQLLYQGVANNTDMTDSLYGYQNGSRLTYSARRAYYVSSYTGSSGYYGDYTTFIAKMNAGDFITIVQRFSVTVHHNPYYTFFTGFLIG